MAKPSVVHADTTDAATTQQAAQDEQAKLNDYKTKANQYVDATKANQAANNEATDAQAAWTAAQTARDPKAMASAADRLEKANAAKETANKAYNDASAAATQAWTDLTNDEIDATSVAHDKQDMDNKKAAIDTAKTGTGANDHSLKQATDRRQMYIKKYFKYNKDSLDALSKYDDAYNAYVQAGKPETGTVRDNWYTARKNLTDHYLKDPTQADDAMSHYDYGLESIANANTKIKNAEKDYNDAKAKYEKNSNIWNLRTYYHNKAQAAIDQVNKERAYAAYVAMAASSTATPDQVHDALQAKRDADAAADRSAKAVSDSKAVLDKAGINPDTTTNNSGNQGNDEQPSVPDNGSTDNNQNNTIDNSNNGKTVYVQYAEHPSWKVALLNDAGQYTQNYVDQNASYTIQGTKTVNGETVYKIGENQWIPAKYTSATASENAETRMSGVARLTPVAGHPTWKIQMMDANGKYTGVYLKPNTSWKVFGKKTINGRTCYRLGSQSQWVPEEYIALQ